mmetsp:Transcript_16405/g.41132  ORF Transcript_16405/g.41132 Transcript_16405/m.41132 type:complete len:332 (+) Transcript_16405:125-1120(+)
MRVSDTTRPRSLVQIGESKMSRPSMLVLAPLLGLLTFLQGTESLIPQTNVNSSQRVNLVSQPKPSKFLQHARRPRDDEEEYYDDDDDFDDFDYDYDDKPRRRRRRRPGGELDDLGYDRRKEDGFLNIPSSFGQRDGWRLPDSVSKALLAGIFILGVGLGVTVDSAINTNPRDLASRDAIDQAAPNSKLCADMGASAMAFDQRVFVSFNPFNVYVAQADVKPACVLRQSNIVPILKGKNLINEKEVAACKANMNTWAFVGDLDNTPQLSCVYKSADAQNEFLSNPKFGIGEDYLDDDRAMRKQNNLKTVKDGMTDAQKQELRKRAANVPGLD